ncbi:MAG: DEAD/DEAH box helicase [Planctomycetota bacterium]
MSPAPSRRRGGRGNRSRRKTSSSSQPAPRDLQPILEPPDVQSFDAWNLDPGVLQGIKNMDIEVPTPIQALSVQPILEGRDLIAKAETGTGKTLAFGAPMMSRVDNERVSVMSLVLCPTRELAQQVAGVLSALGAPRRLSVALLVGGDPIHPQVDSLRQGAQVVVGTPGRVLDLYQQRFLSFPWTEYAVLDEADKMFEIGFLDDIKKILSLLPEERQTLLFSATYPKEVLGLAREFTKDPVEVATARGLATVDSIEQRYLRFTEDDRPLALIRLIENSGPDDVFLVFCERRTDVDRLLRRLEREPFSVKALHGGYDQASRFRVMSAFRSADVKALLATDVAARGLDVEHVTHVVNYSVPREVESYTHRIGRTGRAGRSGQAITFVAPIDRRKWESHLRQLAWDVPEMEFPGRASQRRSPERERPSSRDRDRGRDRDEGTERVARRRSRSTEDDRGAPRRGERARTDRGEARRERGDRSERGRTRDRDRDRDRTPERDRAEADTRGRGDRDGRRRDEEREQARDRDRDRDREEPRRARSRGAQRERETGEERRPPRRRSRGEERDTERTPRRDEERRGERSERRPASRRDEERGAERDERDERGSESRRPRRRRVDEDERPRSDERQERPDDRGEARERPRRRRATEERSSGHAEADDRRRAPDREEERPFGAEAEADEAPARRRRRGGRGRRGGRSDS